MTNNVSSPFYLEWKAEGIAQGTWNGSNTTAASGFDLLANWQLTPNSQHVFNFTTSQGTGPNYAVFAVMRDPTAGRSYGAKFVSSPTPAEASQLTFTPAGQLSFTASRLHSDDPKLKISNSTSQPSVHLRWTVNNEWEWSYTATGTFEKVEGDIEMGPGKVAVFVTDQTSTTNILGVYYLDPTHAPGTNVGIVQSETQINAPGKQVDVDPQFDVSDPFTCTLNLMQTLPTDAKLATSSSTPGPR